MFDSGSPELNEVAALDKGLQPAAEWEGAGLCMEEAPALNSLGVVRFVEVAQQIFNCLRFDQLCVADVQSIRGAVCLLVDLVNDAVAYGYGITSG